MNVWKFIATGFIVLAIFFLAGTFAFTPQARIGVLQSLGFFSGESPIATSAWIAAHPIGAYFVASFGEGIFSLGNYVVGGPHDGESPWYFWPVGALPVLYYSSGVANNTGSVMLMGNPVLWLASTLAVICALAFLFRYAREHRKGLRDRRPVILLFSGYAAAMLPFITIVRRSTFLYHYFPALLFAFGLLGWFAARTLKVQEWSDITPRKSFLLGLCLLAVVAGFLAVAPLTYGL